MIAAEPTIDIDKKKLCCNNARRRPDFGRTGSTRGFWESPIIRNEKGEPISGGMNIIRHSIACRYCGTSFQAQQTELAEAKGEPLTWARRLPK